MTWISQRWFAGRNYASKRGGSATIRKRDYKGFLDLKKPVERKTSDSAKKSVTGYKNDHQALPSPRI